MSNCQFIRRPWIWFLRFRHRKGYGVHSPSAYAFLRGVVYEGGEYYAYERLNRLHPWWQRWLLRYPITCRRLLFRLANEVHPATIAITGDRPLERTYMSAAVPSAEWITVAADQKLPSADLLFITADALPTLALPLPPMPSTGMLVAEGIHANAAARAAWNNILRDAQSIVSYDLYTYGIVRFDNTKHQQHYIVNF